MHMCNSNSHDYVIVTKGRPSRTNRTGAVVGTVPISIGRSYGIYGEVLAPSSPSVAGVY